MKNDINEQDVQYAINRVAEDSTRWDKMTGMELKRRIKALQANEESFEKIVDVISCLRLAEIYYMRTKNKEECAIPLVSTPQGEVLLIFTAKSQIQNAKYKEYAIESARYPALMKSITTSIKQIVVNPDTQFFSFAVEPTDNMISFFDGIENELDAEMEKGINSDKLTPLMFERFWGRRVDCVTKNGHYIGDAGIFDNKQPQNPHSIVKGIFSCFCIGDIDCAMPPLLLLSLLAPLAYSVS